MVDKRHKSFEENVRDLEKLVYPQRLSDYFTIKYYQEKLTCEQIGEELGISGSSVRRYMKFVGVDLRNREQCMKRLHDYTRGRKWDNEEAKTNVSKSVKASYTPELRKQRSKDNVRVWDSMSEQEKKNRCMPGLLVMHSRKRRDIDG